MANILLFAINRVERPHDYWHRGALFSFAKPIWRKASRSQLMIALFMDAGHKTIDIFYRKRPASLAAGERPLQPAWSSARLPILLLLGLTVAGLLLRAICARGDLWLDEIWSLQNLEKIQDIGGIFWGISQDNNHFLNSLWLWFVRPHAPPVLIRLESIICGTLAIPVAARLCGRAGIVAGLSGATLVAGSLIFVEYGSEARGYAGLLLMIFIAAEALEVFLDSTSLQDHAAPHAIRGRIAFSIAVGLGALFHLTMVTAAVSLIFATALRLRARGSALPIVFRAAFDLSVSAALGAAPAVGFVIAGILNTHQIILGKQVPFSFEHLMGGLATLTEATLGLPFETPPWIVLVIALAGICLTALIIPRDRLILPLTVLFLPPIGAAIFRMPSVQIARFHLIGTLGLVLLASYAFGWLLTFRKPIVCLFAGLAIALGMIGGNAFHVAQLVVHGRGHYRKVVLFMESHRREPNGPAPYASNMPAEVSRIVRFYDAGRGNLRPDFAPDWCKAPPDWYILSDDPAGETPTRTFGSQKCAATYRQDMRMVPAPLSGLRWVLYQRAS